MKRGRGGSDGIEGAIAMIILAILALPFVGIYFLTRQDKEQKAVGGALLIAGAVLCFLVFR